MANSKKPAGRKPATKFAPPQENGTDESTRPKVQPMHVAKAATADRQATRRYCLCAGEPGRRRTGRLRPGELIAVSTARAPAAIRLVTTSINWPSLQPSDSSARMAGQNTARIVAGFGK